MARYRNQDVVLYRGPIEIAKDVSEHLLMQARQVKTKAAHQCIVAENTETLQLFHNIVILPGAKFVTRIASVHRDRLIGEIIKTRTNEMRVHIWSIRSERANSNVPVLRFFQSRLAEQLTDVEYDA